MPTSGNKNQSGITGVIVYGHDGSHSYAVDVDSRRRIMTAPSYAKTAFGLMAVAELEPVVQLQFSYNINTLTTTSINDNMRYLNASRHPVHIKEVNTDG